MHICILLSIMCARPCSAQPCVRPCLLSSTPALPLRQHRLAQPPVAFHSSGACCRTWMGYVDADSYSIPKTACGCCWLLCPLPHLRCHVATSLKTSDQPQREATGRWEAVAPARCLQHLGWTSPAPWCAEAPSLSTQSLSLPCC